MSTNTTSITFDTVTEAAVQPLSRKAIVIQPNDTSQDVPDDAVTLWDAATAPTNWHVCDGLASTPDLDQRFILGADAAGDGGAAAGSVDHAHTVANHSHTNPSHAHATTLAGAANPTRRWETGTPTASSREDQHHNITLGSATPADTSTDAMTVDVASNDPAYVKLMAVQNQTGGQDTPDGVILGFVGSAASPPTGYDLCDGTNGTPNCIDVQVKCTKTASEIGNTGGSDAHTHTTQSHGHTVASHTHSSGFPTMTNVATIKQPSGSDTIIKKQMFGHFHVWTIGSTAQTISAQSPTSSSTDSRASRRTCVFVKKSVSAGLKRITLGTIHKSSKLILAG